jgi:fatty acid desaturase
VALGISLVAEIVLVLLPFLLVAVFLGPLVGWLTFEVVRRVTAKRRGRYMAMVAAACIAAVGLPALMVLVISQSFMGLLINCLYLALAATSAFAWLRVDQQ